MSIFLQRHPTRAIELIKYADLVPKSAQLFTDNGWVYYDREFRLEQAQNPSRTWASYDADLLLEKLALPTFADFTSMSGQRQDPQTNRYRHNFRPNQQFTAQRPKQDPIHCFNFNKSGKCTKSQCRYPHRCSLCFKYYHAATNCPTKYAPKKGLGPAGGQSNIQPQQPQPARLSKPNFVKGANTNSSFSA